MQSVGLNLRVIFHPNPDAVARLRQTYGQNFTERIMPNICTEVLRSVVVCSTSTMLPQSTD